MIPTPPHTKIKTTRQFQDGRVEIDSHSTYKELNSVKQEVGQNIETTPESLAAEVMRCLRHLTDGETSEMAISIKRTGARVLITKTYLLNKEYYGR